MLRNYKHIFKHLRPKSGYIYKTDDGEVLIQRGTKNYDYFAPSHWGGFVLGTLDECQKNIYEVRESAQRHLRNVVVNPEYYGDDWEYEYNLAKEYVAWAEQIDVIMVESK